MSLNTVEYGYNDSAYKVRSYMNKLIRLKRLPDIKTVSKASF